MRVEHTGDGVTRRPTVLKTVAVTGLHALPYSVSNTLRLVTKDLLHICCISLIVAA